MQIITGILLSLVYVPSAGEAYDSLEYLNYVQPLGWYVRALHDFFANAMVFMLICHLAQVVRMPTIVRWDVNTTSPGRS